MTRFVHQTVSTEVVDHGSTTFDGLCDRKGRQIGFTWTITRLTTRLTEGYGYVFEDADTERFVGHTHATRNKHTFGASTAGIYGKTLEEIRQAIATRAANCEKRYTRQFPACSRIAEETGIAL